MVMFRQIKILDPDYLAPKQFFKLVEYSSDFPCARVCRISFSPIVTVGLGFELERFFTALYLNLNK